MRVYVGMDVHRKRSQVAVVDDIGVLQGNRNVADDLAKLVPILGVLAPGTPVAFEAAYGWGWLVELLEELELEPHLVHPSRCKAIASARLKNDKVDAATLAQLLRVDLLAEAWIAPQATRDLRALLRHRASLVRRSTSLKNRVHGCAGRPRQLRALQPVDSARSGLAGWPGAASDPPGDHSGLLWAAGRPGHPDRPAGAGDRRAGQVRPAGPGAHGLPGIGRLTAMTPVAEIGDNKSVPDRAQAVRLGGLTPQVRNSDRKVRHGHITKQGSPWVRWVLQEAAQTAKRYPMFADTYGQLATGGAATSPPPRSLGGCWPAASTS
jgi:transposase